MYRLKIQKAARRQLKAVLPKDIRQEIINAVRVRLDDPYLPDTQLEDELLNRYRLKINGLRVLYKVDEQDKVITVLTVRKRNRNIYLNVP